jgi:hypothetical protein
VVLETARGRGIDHDLVVVVDAAKNRRRRFSLPRRSNSPPRSVGRQQDRVNWVSWVRGELRVRDDLTLSLIPFASNRSFLAGAPACGRRYDLADRLRQMSPSRDTRLALEEGDFRVEHVERFGFRVGALDPPKSHLLGVVGCKGSGSV